jgi:hypothetical protein
MLMWLSTLAFASTVVLFLPLVVLPYWNRQLGEDPRNQPPYSWQGAGSFTYEMADNVHIWMACLAIPALVVQGLLLMVTWDDISKIEKSVHLFFFVISLALWLFAIFGTSGFLFWYVD